LATKQPGETGHSCEIGVSILSPNPACKHPQH
jgi:hypothetical protein